MPGFLGGGEEEGAPLPVTSAAGEEGGEAAAGETPGPESASREDEEETARQEDAGDLFDILVESEQGADAKPGALKADEKKSIEKCFRRQMRRRGFKGTFCDPRCEECRPIWKKCAKGYGAVLGDEPPVCPKD